MNIRNVPNVSFGGDIVTHLKQLVVTERKVTAEIIEAIQSIDQKKIYLQIGFPTLFAFLTEHIGYTAASAQRRIDAARLLVSVPEIKTDVQNGRLNLSQVSMVAQSIRQKQKESPELEFKAEDKKSLLESVKGLSLENSQKVLSQTLDLEVKDYEKQKVQSNESVRIELTFTKEQNEMLKKVKSLMSHVNPNVSVAEVFEYLAKEYLERKDPSRPVNKSTTVTELRPQSESLTHSSLHARQSKFAQVQSAKRNRKAILSSVKRAVWKRDQGKCQHFNPTLGKICGSNHLLEFDHIKRFSYGGDDSTQNLRLLCNAHNLLRG